MKQNQVTFYNYFNNIDNNITLLLLLDQFYLDKLPSLIHHYRFDPCDIQGTLVLNHATNLYDGSLVSGATVTATNTHIVGSGALRLIASNIDPSSHFSIINGILLGKTGITFAIWYVIVLTYLLIY